MSTIAATTMENALIMTTERFQKFEKRRPNLGVAGAFTKYGDQLVDAATIEANRKSATRQTNISVLNRQTTPIRDTRSVNITPVGSTSAKVGLNWKSYGFDVGVVEAINADNAISAAADLSNQLEQGIRDVLKAIDADFTAFLELGKYSALPSSTLMAISGGNYVTTESDLYIKTPAIMRYLEQEGPYHVISNVESLATLTELSIHGTYNDQNRQKLIDNYEFGYSKNIIPGTGNKNAYFFIPTGSLSMLQWQEYDSRRPTGRGSYDSGFYYDTMTLEFTALGGETFSLTFGFMYKGTAQDNSSVKPGLERSKADAWSLFVDIAPVKAYSSEPGKSPIVKIVTQ